MAACKSVVVVCPNARRQTVKVGPTSTILQILEEVCKKQGFSSQENAIKHQRKILDETLPIRYSGLTNNAHLELVHHTKTSKDGAQSTVGLHLATGDRLIEDFPPAFSLWDVICHWNSLEGSPHHGKLLGVNGQVIVCIYMTQKISGESALRQTTLHSLGLTGRRAIIRLLHELPAEEKSQAVETPSNENTLNNPNQSTEELDTEQQINIPGVPATDNEGETVPTAPQAVAQGNITANDGRHRPLESGTVSPDRAAKDPKRSRIVTGQQPLFTDFKFPERHTSEDLSKTGNICITEERKQLLATPCDRVPLVFNEDNSMPQIPEQGDPPDSFFEVTVDDLRKMLQDLHSKRTGSVNSPLMTKSMREARLRSESYKYDKIVIRIKFPDQLTLQGFFRPHEKVFTLSEFVRSHLVNPSMSFYLYTTPPKTVLQNQEHTLFEADLCPASLVYFGSKEKQDHYLATRHLQSLVTLLDAEKAVLHSGVRVQPHQASPSQHITSNGQSPGHEAGDAAVESLSNEEATVAQAASYRPPASSTGSKGPQPKWFKGTGK